jgi:cation diffusion facilitator CzcD-associated flavoprotein CzcO
MIATACDVAIVGGGPYALSAAAHLRAIKGMEIQVFGEPMSFWRQMPTGMLLRSNWTATHIADPNRSLTLEEYQAATGDQFSVPVPLDRFIQYGLWYQRHAVPDLVHEKVLRIESSPRGFLAFLAHGRVVRARHIVIAVGVASFAWRPPEFEGLPACLASHSSEHRDLAQFAGRQVVVIGSGQSALESAALLAEGGARVEVIARARNIHWLQGWASRLLHHGLSSTTSRLLYAPTDVGPAGISQLVSRPDLLKQLPRRIQDRLRKRSVRPAAARWLQTRLGDVPIVFGRRVVSARRARDQVKIRLDDGSERTVDHVLLGTGYRVDISKYDFLAPELLQSIERSNGYPRLRAGLETSVPGLHVLGAPAAYTFGPLMQFVSGTHYASRSLAHCIARKSGVHRFATARFSLAAPTTIQIDDAVVGTPEM